MEDKSINMIPKIIHYCWLSNEPFPNLIRTCMDSWKRYLPDYEFKRWSLENFDINSVLFVKEAYECRKWAFAADYIRLYALFREGGIYLDSDVLLKKSLDPFLLNRAFSAIEYNSSAFNKSLNMNIVDESGELLIDKMSIPGLQIQAAVIGSIKNNEYIRACMNYYENTSFILNNGSYNADIIAPDIMAYHARNYGFKYKDEIQDLDVIKIYPSETFAGHPALATKNTYAIHCCNGSWREKTLQRRIINYIRKNLAIRFLHKK